jgi:superfamily I DNA and/or RNA helicase
MPEWLMAMSVAKKCILVGDHKQLPPTFCTEESEVLKQMEDHKERLIRNGVIERLFENLPSEMKGTLGKQYRMLPHIGQFISHHFYKGELEHHRTETDHEFQDFGWFTYKSNGYRVPAQQGKEVKVLINDFEIRVIMTRLAEINDRHKRAKAERKISVALITPYRAQCNALRQALKKHDFSKVLAVEVDTVDAFQGRQADIVFFSFVRNTGPATFYADDRRMNVAISRARDAVYLVGDIEYIRSKHLPVLDALAKLPILIWHRKEDV